MVFLTVSVIMSISSVVGMVAIGAAAEAAECDKVNKKSKQVAGNYASVVKSLRKYMEDINSNSEQIRGYLGELSDEMEELREEYSNSLRRKNETYINIQIFGVVLLLIIIIFFVYRYIKSDKISFK